MERRIILWTFIGVLFLVALYMVFQAGVRGSTTGLSTDSSSASNTGKIDTTGWTENEIMNYEMHGTIPARVERSVVSTGNSGMVGGC